MYICMYIMYNVEYRKKGERARKVKKKFWIKLRLIVHINNKIDQIPINDIYADDLWDEHEKSVNRSQVVICEFKAVSPAVCLDEIMIPVKYLRYMYTRSILCKTQHWRAGVLTSSTLTIRFNPRVRYGSLPLEKVRERERTVRKGEEKSRAGRERDTRGTIRGRGK